MQVITIRNESAEGDDDGDGGQDSTSGRSGGLDKAVDDKFKEISTFLNKKVIA